jgi:hypothetical protein
VHGSGLRRFRGRAGAAVVSDALMACDVDGVRAVDVSAHPLGDGGFSQLVQVPCCLDLPTQKLGQR